MHSGNLCIVLTEAGTWESFPAFAEKYCEQIDAIIVKRIDGPDVRVWEIEVEGIIIRLVYDDYPNGVSLESEDDRGDEIIKRLFKRIEAEKSDDGV
jgi:hypothetical protein